MKHILLFSIAFLLMVNTHAQSDTTKTNPDSASSDWSFAADGYLYLIPDEDITGIVIGYADYKAIHMEARYNYENLNTGSLFGGYTFETGNKVSFSATPMLGAVFGEMNGIAPALELDLIWKRFEFYSESEYVFDFKEKENDFFYVWSQLSYEPFDNFVAGISVQRTKLYQTAFDFQRGIFAQYSFWKLTTGVFYFNPFHDDHFLIFNLGIQF